MSVHSQPPMPSYDEQQPLVHLEEDSQPQQPPPRSSSGRIDVRNHRYPFCLVWGPLPIISWIIPWIGHLGIADSEGKVHDFAGPYTIGVDDFMTPIAKYYQFPRELWAGKEAAWDQGIQQADAQFRKLFHNLATNNCHHHSARALCNMKLASSDVSQMSMLQSFWLISTKGTFISVGAWLMTYLPFILGLLFWAWVLTRVL